MYGRDNDGIFDYDAHLHVPIERVIGKIGAADDGGLVDEGAFDVQLAGFVGLVPLPVFQGPVEHAHLVEADILECFGGIEAELPCGGLLAFQKQGHLDPAVDRFAEVFA